MDKKITLEIIRVAREAMDESGMDDTLMEIVRLATTGMLPGEWLDSLTADGEFVEVA